MGDTTVGPKSTGAQNYEGSGLTDEEFAAGAEASGVGKVMEAGKKQGELSQASLDKTREAGEDDAKNIVKSMTDADNKDRL